MTFALRNYQLEAVDKTMAGFEVYDRQCIVLGTGGGKTEIFIEAAKRYLDNNPGMAVLVLSHLSILTIQTLERFKLRDPSIKTGVLQANVRPYVLSDVVIGTMQSSRNQMKSEFLKKRLVKKIGMLIIDEAHYLPTDSYQKILSYYPDAKVLGMTATPFRSNQLMTNYFENIPYSLSIHELIDMGYLVPPKIWQVHRPSDDLKDVIGQVVSLYSQREAGKRAIVFMKTKDDCRALREVMNLHHITTEVITDDTDDRSRRRILRDFRGGGVRVLVSVNVLTAGFDCPPVQAIFMPYGTASTTTYLQRIGRGLRLCDEIGKEHCSIYSFGPAPEIDRGFYQRAANLDLNMKDKLREYPTVTETYDMNWMDELTERSEQRNWTIKVRDAVMGLEKHGYSTLAGSLNRRELPDSITLNVMDYLAQVRLVKKKPKDSLPSKAQLKRLEKLMGFVPTDLSKADARLLEAILSGVDEQDIVTSGLYEKCHITDLPQRYQRYILSKYPDSGVSQQIMSWRERKSS